MKFIEVAHSFNEIEPISGRLEITRLLAQLLKKASPQEAEIITSLSLGQLHPPHIGTQFNIAEKNLLKAIAQFLNTSPDTIKKELKHIGDIGLIFNEYTWNNTAQLSVTDVYHALCKLEKMSGTGSQEEKIIFLSDLFNQLDPLSAKFIARIIIGKLRLGFSDMTIIDALSWMETGNKSIRSDLEHAYNMCADIGLIAKILKENGITAIKHMSIKVGTPILPAAAERLPTAQAIFKKLHTCYAEPKLDGFRLQIHVDNTTNTPKINFFSRNLQNMSAMFPDITKELLKLNVKNLICEGEAIGYDPNTNGFLPFQETVKRKRKHGIEQAATEFPLQLFLFDLLYLNDQSYLNIPYIKRHQQLEKLLHNVKSEHIFIIEHKEIHTAKSLEDYFFATVATGLEGLVVKRPEAPYQPGKRNFNWIKLKRQEEGHLEDTIDCVVLGYYAGKGKRTHFGIGAFLVGVFNKELDMFQTVAKIGTGMTDSEWRELKKKCDSLTVAEKPKNIQCAKELIPDKWVTPDIVCRVRADEITLSPLHSAGKTEKNLGYALRFPRFMDYRFDKGAEEATTDDEIKRLYEDQFIK
ncbi:MAG TPA: ATP-dependent DNA ligase [Candidatus Babeliales bacterium]|nr:ATP-dependent DNA ligase [Candidatus Babeliales bacterium]